MNTSKKLSINIKIGILSAIAFILMMFEVPIVPAFPWLQVDLSDVPALIGAFAFGPVAGVVIELLKNVLKMLLMGTSTGGVGELANFLIGIAFVVPAAIVYKKGNTKKLAIVGMLVGTVAIVLMGILANIFILLPLYGMKMTATQLTSYIIAGIIPVNIIKAVLDSVVTYILYKKLATTMFKVAPMGNSTNRKNVCILKDEKVENVDSSKGKTKKII